MATICKLVAFMLCVLSCCGQQGHRRLLLPARPANAGLTPMLWLKSESVVGNTGDNLTNWVDSSGNNYHATNRNLGSAMGPPLVVSNMIVVTNLTTTNRYSAAAFYWTNWLALSEQASNILNSVTGATFFLVYRTNGYVPGYSYSWLFNFHGMSSGNRSRLGLYLLEPGYLQTRAQRVSGEFFETTGNITKPADGFKLISIKHDYLNGNVTLYTNGVIATNAVGVLTTGTSDNQGYQWHTIGSFDRTTDQTLSWIGWMAELILYNHPLSDTNRQQVEQYLTNKFGLSP